MKKILTSFINYLKIEKGLSYNTIQAYTADISDFIEYCNDNGISNIKKVDNENLINFTNFLYNINLKNNSIIRKLHAIRHFFKYCYIEKIITENPTEIIDIPKKVQYLPSYITVEEFEKLLPKYKKPNKSVLRNTAIIELLFSSGLRVSELINIKISDVDFDNYLIKVTGKGSKERLVPIGNYAINAINTYLEFIGKDKKRDADTYLFENKFKTKLSRQYIWMIIKKYLKTSSIDKEISPHTLRHSFATALVSNNADIRTVQEMLGHSDISTTQIYTHISMTKLKKVHNKYHPRD